MKRKRKHRKLKFKIKLPAVFKKHPRKILIGAAILLALVVLLSIPGLKTGESIRYNGSMTESRALVEHDVTYIPVELAKTFPMMDGAAVDLDGRRLTADLSRISLKMADSPTTDFLQTWGGTVYIPMVTRNEQLYFPLEICSDLLGVKYKESGGELRITDRNLKTATLALDDKKKFDPGNEKINLVWQYVSTTTEPPQKRVKGVDILAPTWFDLILNGNGSVTNKGDLAYTRQAHNNGYRVWATVTNGFESGNTYDFTSACLNTESIRNKIAAQFLFYACLYDTDGINIDFESVYDSNANELVDFTATLRNYTERQGLNLSIDVLIPKPWTVEYDRTALSESVDYIAMMAYDEHYAGCSTPGSTASLTWVEEAVLSCLEEVPAEKLLLGIPLYTRVWTTNGSGTIVDNTAIGMETAHTILEERDLTPTLDESTGQYYVTYQTDSGTAQIWLEDSSSIASRLELVQANDLAGSACWQLTQATDDIWSVFNGMLKHHRSAKKYDDPY